MKRWLARVEHSERSTPAVRCRLCTSKPKLHIVLLACGWLSDAMLPCFRVKKHSAIFSFVYLKIITRKNIWRNVIFSSKKKKSWEKFIDCRILPSHTPQSRLPPSKNNFKKKSLRSFRDFYFFLHLCGLRRGNQEFSRDVSFFFSFLSGK